MHITEVTRSDMTDTLTRNDAVVPISDSYDGCSDDPNGLCSFDTVVSVLQKRIDEIDFEYDCFANYTATAGNDYNGRAPRETTATEL